MRRVTLTDTGPLISAAKRILNERRSRKEQSMRTTWTSIAGLGACSLLGVLLLSDTSWAVPKKGSAYTCKCTCEAEDVLGKVHYGPAEFTESSAERCVFHRCTVGSQRLEGKTRNCSVTEPTSIRPGITPGVQLEPSTTPGGMRRTTPGMVTPRGVEGEQPDAGTANPSGTTPGTK